MELVELGNYVEILSGFAFNSKLFNDKGDGIQLIRIRDVGKNTSNTFYPGDYDKKFIVKNGDFLIGMDGDFRLSEWKGKDGLLNQRVCKIWSKNINILSDKYLLYLLPSELKYIEDSTSYATVKHLSVKKIQEIKIPLPPLATQKRIAAILDEADTLRQLNQQLIDKYNALTQSLFLEMFGDPVTNPKGWEKVPMSKMCDFKKVSIKPEDILAGTKYMPLDAIEKESGKILGYEIVESGEIKSNKFYFTNEHILYGKLRPYLNKVALPNFEGICSTDMIPLKPNNKSNKYFISQIMRGKGFVAFANERSSGANLPRISPNEIQKYKIINPPIHLQNQFAEHVKLIEQQKAQAQEALHKSEALFNSLLQRAFNGGL